MCMGSDSGHDCAAPRRYLSLFAMCGCMVRIACKQTWASKHTDHIEEIFPDVLANMLGW